MKMLKNEAYDDDDDSNVLLGFDEGTTTYYSENKSEANNSTTNATQYFRWTPESTKMMLTLRFDMDRLFSQRVRQKKDLWNEIASEMGRLGCYVITGEVCDLKFRNMLQTYKKNRLKEMRGLQDLIVWEYYTFFKEAALRNGNEGSSDQVIPSLLCESVCAEDSQQETPQHHELTAKEMFDSNNHITVIPPADKEPEATKSTTNRRAAKTKRPRLASPHSHTDNSCEEQDHQLIELKSKTVPLQRSQNQSAQPTASPQLEQPAAAILPTANIAACNASGCLPPPTPNWLNPTELSECQVFGQSVGLQLANVRDSYSRSLLKLKIQELIFLAGTGKLPDKYTFSYD